jgi:hypothetical protein
MQRERGLSLIGLIFILAILGFVLVVGFKLPTYIENYSVKSVLASMVQSGETRPVAEIAPSSVVQILPISIPSKRGFGYRQRRRKSDNHRKLFRSR